MIYSVAMKHFKHRTTHIPRVIVVVSMHSSYGPSVLRGVFAHIAARGEWGLEIIRSAADFTANTIEKAIGNKTDGCIIALNEDCPDAYRALVGSGIPFVTIETFSEILNIRRQNAFHIRIDNAAIGKDAAQNFLKQGRYSAFGFVPPSNDRPWSQARNEGFNRELARRGHLPVAFKDKRSTDAVVRRGDLAKWLRRLDKPAAIFAADDAVALEVVQACQSAHLKVPNDIAVLGVDDEPLICENIKPALSSIRPAFTDAGRTAAEMLERMMHWRASPTPAGTTVVKGRNEIVTRSSTRPESSAGLLVQEAIAFIQANVRHGIGIENVRAHLGVSRALMDLRFREVRNESVLGVLTEARLKELKHMLVHTDKPIGEITARLGWTSPNYPKRLFKERFGIPMSVWRRRNRDS